MANEYRVKVFFGSEQQGTWASVFFPQEPLSAREMQQQATKTNAPATIFVWPNGNELLVHSFNSSHEILVCGHGILAAVYCWQQILAARAREGSFADTSIDDFQIRLASQQVIQIKHQEKIWIGFEVLEPVMIAPPNWLYDAFMSLPIKSAKVGAASDYLICEWPADFNLAELRPNFKKICHHTQRSIIATQACDGGECDFKLRYFAPQYGVDEDRATGSANRVLASYWKKDCNQTQALASSSQSFKAIQVSSSGAVIFGQVMDNRVWISGEVAFID